MWLFFFLLGIAVLFFVLFFVPTISAIPAPTTITTITTPSVTHRIINSHLVVPDHLYVSPHIHFEQPQVDNPPFTGKLLILVLADGGETHMHIETNGIRKTWASEASANDQVLFYYADNTISTIKQIDDRIYIPISETFENTWPKTLLALQYVAEKYPNVEYVFRSNTSSYVHLKLLRQWIGMVQRPNDENLFSGYVAKFGEEKFCTNPPENEPFISGSGYLINRPTLQWLCSNGIQEPTKTNRWDDGELGAQLAKTPTAWIDAPRYAFEESRPETDADKIPITFHYRCKAEDRKQDVYNMLLLHKKFSRLSNPLLKNSSWFREMIT